LPARLSARRLTGFLNGADSFFGDAGMANHTLFPHAFGLKNRGHAMDPARLRPLSFSRIGLPHSNDLHARPKVESGDGAGHAGRDRRLSM
jgi:hypothetical protein